MARTSNKISSGQLLLLRECLQQAFGKKIKQSVHCEGLSAHIKKTTGQYISAQTLRRIFGFIQSPFAPSVTNLDILSQYCGYADWNELGHANEKEAFIPLTPADEASLYLNLYRIDLKDEGDSNYHYACRHIAERIVTNPALFHQLAAPLAAHSTSQIFFYERFPFIDGLGSYYTKGLRFYLQHKKEAQAQIFGNSLLLLAGVLTNNQPLAQKHFTILSKTRVDTSFHPFAIARLLGSKILYKTYFGKEADLENELKEVYVWAKYFSIPSKIKFWLFPYYQLMITEYLNLSGLYGHGHAVMETVAARQADQYQIEKGYSEILELTNHIARHQHQPKVFLKWVDDFNGWNNISPIFRKFYRLQVLSHLIKLKKEKADGHLQQELEELVAGTGFTFFLHRP